MGLLADLFTDLALWLLRTLLRLIVSVGVLFVAVLIAMAGWWVHFHLGGWMADAVDGTGLLSVLATAAAITTFLAALGLSVVLLAVVYVAVKEIWS